MPSTSPLRQLTPEEDQSLMQARWVTSFRWQQMEEKTYEEGGFTRSSYAALLFLRHGPLRSGHLAGLVRMTSGGVAKMLSQLESQQHIERRRGFSDDLRAVEIAITAQGADAVTAMSTSLVDIMRGDFAAAGITKDEVEAVRSVWHKVANLDVEDLDRTSSQSAPGSGHQPQRTE